MRKILFLVLTCMMTVSLCACGEKKEEKEPKTPNTVENSQTGADSSDLNQHINEIHPEFVSLKENTSTVYLRSTKESDKLTIYEETIYNKRDGLILADYFKRVETVDEANADAQVQEWKDMLDRFGFEYASVEYVDGKVVVEYCTTNTVAIINMGVIPDIEQEKNLRELSGSTCQIIE